MIFDPENPTSEQRRLLQVRAARLRRTFNSVRADRADATELESKPATEESTDMPRTVTRLDNETDDMDPAARLDALNRDHPIGDADDVTMSAVRAQRDREAASMWRADVSDAEHAKWRRKALRDVLRLSFGDPGISKTDVDDLIRARGGDTDVASMSPDGFRALLGDVRKKRAASAAATISVNTDAGDDAIENARRERDARALAMGR